MHYPGGRGIDRAVYPDMEQYFADLDGETPSAIYDMVVGCVEKPLLQVILHIFSVVRFVKFSHFVSEL